MVTPLLTGNAAAAWAARLADVAYVPAFPITPQTEIIETLSAWFHDGTMRGKFVTLDSEHSMMTAAGAAAATGVRTFTATSSQGLLYAMEVLYSVSGWRVPFVLVNVSRALAAPITLGPDHNDVLAARDSGFVQLHAETCQEVFDSILMAYRIAEDPRVCLPVLVNLDGFVLSFTREPVSLPTEAQVREFLPPFRAVQPPFRASRPVAHGVAVLEAAQFSFFRYQLHHAMRAAIQVHTEAAQDFERIFGRRYDVIDPYRMDDAEYVLVMAGSFSTKGRAAVDRWRANGRRVGLLRLRMIRPRPTAALVTALSHRKGIAVLDQNLSPGLGGILFQEVAAAIAASSNHRHPLPALRSFVGGLGGKEISEAEFDHLLSRWTETPASSDGHPQSDICPADSCSSGFTSSACGGMEYVAERAEPELLMTEREWAMIANRLAIAGKSPPEVTS